MTVLAVARAVGVAAIRGKSEACLNDRIPFLVGDDPQLATWFDVVDPATLDADFAKALGSLAPPSLRRLGPVAARGHAVPAVQVPGFRQGSILRLARVGGDDVAARAAAAYGAVRDGAQGIVASVQAADVADPARLDEATALDPRATAWVIELGPSVSPRAALDAVARVGRRRGHDGMRPASVRFDAWADALMAGGPVDEAELASSIADASVSVWTADARGVDGAGAGSVVRLAYVLASLSATAAALDASGVRVAQASGVGVVWPVGLQLLEEVAALRALRLAWAALAAAWDAPALSMQVSAITSTTWLTTEDPANNTLRATLAVAAAMMGGADTVEVAEPGAGFDGASRLAVTGPSVLAWEARLDQMGDVGAGAATVESRTAALLDAAWTLAASWDALGGLSTEAVRTEILTACEADRCAAERDIRARRQTIIGVSQSPAPLGAPAPLGEGWRRASSWANARRRFEDAGVAFRPTLVGAPPPWRSEAVASFAALGSNTGSRGIALLIVSEAVSRDEAVAAVAACRASGAIGVVVAAAGCDAFGADARWAPGDDVIEVAELALARAEGA